MVGFWRLQEFSIWYLLPSALIISNDGVIIRMTVKWTEISGLAEDLSASQELQCSMYLVNQQFETGEMWYSSLSESQFCVKLKGSILWADKAAQRQM